MKLTYSVEKDGPKIDIPEEDWKFLGIRPKNRENWLHVLVSLFRKDLFIDHSDGELNSVTICTWVDDKLVDTIIIERHIEVRYSTERLAKVELGSD